MEDEDIVPNTIQLIWWVWADSRASTQYSSIVYRHDFLPIPTGSALCIWLNIFFFHFAFYSIYNLLIYDPTTMTRRFSLSCGIIFIIKALNLLRFRSIDLPAKRKTYAQRLKIIKTGEVFYLPVSSATEVTADLVCMGRKSWKYKEISGQEYSCTGMTYCPCRLLVKWPVDHSKKNLVNI